MIRKLIMPSLVGLTAVGLIVAMVAFERGRSRDEARVVKKFFEALYQKDTASLAECSHARFAPTLEQFQERMAADKSSTRGSHLQSFTVVNKSYAADGTATLEFRFTVIHEALQDFSPEHGRTLARSMGECTGTVRLAEQDGAWKIVSFSGSFHDPSALFVADDFGLSIEDVVAADGRVEKRLVVEVVTSSGKAARQLMVGVGETRESLTGIGSFVQHKSTATLSVQLVEKEGSDTASLELSLKVHVQGAGSVSTAGPIVFPAAAGQKLADLLTFDAKPGRYEIGKPVRLGKLITADGERPITLHVGDQ